MGQTVVEQLKEEISGYYVEDFKKGLNWIQSFAFSQIDGNVKDILTGKKNLPEHFNEVEEFGWWKDIINFFSPSTANKIFEFMKEKRIAIEQRKTEAELISLRAEVLGGTVISGQSIEENDQTSQVVQGDQSVQDGGDQLVQNEGDQSAQNEGNQPVQNEGDQDNTSGDDEGEQEDGKKKYTGETQTKEHSKEAIEAGISTSVGFGGSAMVVERMSGSYDIKAMQEGIDASKTKELISSCVDNLEEQLKLQEEAIGHRMGKRKMATIRKNIEKIRSGMDDIEDEAIDVLKEWQKFQKEIPNKLLESSGLSQKQLWKLEKYSDELAEAGNDTVKMRKILQSHGLGEIDEDILKIFAKADSVQELKTMTRIVANGRRITRIAQTLSSALMVDVIFSGLDVWMYFETKKEAELIEKVNQKRAENKYNQATYQLAVGLGSVVLEAMLICGTVGSVGGPLGTAIGIGVGVLAGTLSMGGDALYFDVQDFYTQNREDFLREKKSQVTQAILQGIHNKKVGNSSMNESCHEFFSRSSTEEIREGKDISLQDACRSLLFLDELDGGDVSGYNQLCAYLRSGKKKEDYISGLSQEDKEFFERARNTMDEKIAKRMEYLDFVFKRDDVITKLGEGLGMDYLNTVIVESRGYLEMKEHDAWDSGKSYGENIEKYKTTFFEGINEEKLNNFEKLKVDNPELFQEILVTVDLSGFVGEDDTSDENYLENLKLVKRYKQRVELTQTQGEKIMLEVSEYDRSTDFIEKLISVDFNLSQVVCSTVSQEGIAALMKGNWERRGLLDISDDPIQNVLYRLARELYGYSGENSKEGVMGFFEEGNDATHGIYFSSKWVINNDWAVDTGVDLKDLNGKVFNSEAEVDEYVSTFISGNIGGKSTIDTATEAIDGHLQKEFKDKFAVLLKEELMLRLTSNQEKVKQELIEFVKKNSGGDGYVELPYYILLQAKKAGLGDFQRKFFRWKDGQLEVCVMPSEIHDNLLDAKVTYISTLREEFTEEEMYYINRVENAHKRLQSLRKKLGDSPFYGEFEDDLDLPTEVERIIGDKYKEWEKFKMDMKLYGGLAASSSGVYKKYEEFAEYFEGMYRGILLLESTFSVSNDIDSYDYFSRILMFGGMGYFDENGKIKEELKGEDSKLEIFKEKGFVDFYEEQISVQKVGEKTIAELWKSQNREERLLAKQASNIIITTVLEEGILDFDDSGSVTMIYIGKTEALCGIADSWSDESDSGVSYRGKSKENTVKKIVERLKEVKIAPHIDENKITNMAVKTQEIKEVSEKDTQVIQGIPELQKQIENTKDNIVWQDRRGDIVYDPEKSTISSWGTEVKVSQVGEYFYLDGLNLPLSVSEVCFIANLRNWAVSELAGEKIVHGYTQVGIFERRKGLLKKTSMMSKDIMILKDNDLKGKYGINMSDENIDDLAKWLDEEV